MGLGYDSCEKQGRYWSTKGRTLWFSRAYNHPDGRGQSRSDVSQIPLAYLRGIVNVLSRVRQSLSRFIEHIHHFLNRPLGAVSIPKTSVTGIARGCSYMKILGRRAQEETFHSCLPVLCIELNPNQKQSAHTGRRQSAFTHDTNLAVFGVAAPAANRELVYFLDDVDKSSVFDFLLCLPCVEKASVRYVSKLAGSPLPLLPDVVVRHCPVVAPWSKLNIDELQVTSRFHVPASTLSKQPRSNERMDT